MQYRGLRVRVQSGSAIVRQVWRALGSLGGTGGIAAGAALSWTGSGVGVAVFEQGTELEFYRTSGALPSIGTVLTSGTATFTITAFPSENLSATSPIAAYPGLFSTTGGSQGPLSSGDEFYIVGEPVHVVSGTISDDNFTLTANWSGTTPLTNVEAVVNRDFTSVFGWPLVEQGSRIPFAVMKETIRRIDASVAAGGGGGGGGGPLPTYTNFALTNSWVNESGRASAAHAYSAATDTVLLKGYVNKGSAATEGETIVAAGGLPSGRRPSQRLDFWHGGEPFAIQTNGSITYQGPGGVPGPISFNGIVFLADGS